MLFQRADFSRKQKLSFANNTLNLKVAKSNEFSGSFYIFREKKQQQCFDSSKPEKMAQTARAVPCIQFPYIDLFKT